MEVLRRGLDSKATQIRYELLSTDTLEKTVADFVEGIGVLDRGGDFRIALEAGEHGKERFGGGVWG